MKIYKDFTWDSAHFLPKVTAGHKCGRMHGHTYTLRVHVWGPVQSGTGWVVDYADIAAVVQPLVDSLDHRLLNDIPGLENPTTEILCKWLWDRIKPSLSLLQMVEVKESSTTGCSFEGHL